MSTEENAKDDSDLAEKPTETQTKPAKDRKNRKDKVKPMTKVCACSHGNFSLNTIIPLIIWFCR